MKEQQWTFIDRSKWERGEWDDEPDKVQWTDETTGLVCLIHRAALGHLCGYVGVPPGHRYHEVEFTDVDADCHGGLTYADHCAPDHDPVTGRGICHVPEPGEPDDLWWLGFDCGHAWDVSPGLDATVSELRGGQSVRSYNDSINSMQHYRNIAYVRLNVTALALQLAGPQEDICAD
jgi:hypothetical protein